MTVAAEHTRRRALVPSLPTLALLAASYAFRLPPLLNARSTNSDAAVVGLQAMHMLRGELSPFLWGSGYQTSADSLVAARFFAVLGPSPLVLMLSALTLHVVAHVPRLRDAAAAVRSVGRAAAHAAASS